MNLDRKIYGLILIGLCCWYYPGQAQQVDSVNILNRINAIKNQSYSNDAAELIREMILRNQEQQRQSAALTYDQYQRTSISIFANEKNLKGKISRERIKNGYVFRKVILPMESWMDYAEPTGKDGELELTTLLTENYRKVSQNVGGKGVRSHLLASHYEGFYELLGQQNIDDLLSQVFGDINLFSYDSQLLLLSFRNPLAKEALSVYQYHLLEQERVGGIDCQVIAFFASPNSHSNTFAGYLYVTKSQPHTLVQSIFSLNDPEQMNFIQNLLITHTFAQVDSLTVATHKESRIQIGNPYEGALSALRTEVAYTSAAKVHADKDSVRWEQIRPFPLTESQKQVSNLMTKAHNTKVFTLFQDVILLLLSNHVSVGGINGSVELGPISQFISWNDMEGVRLKIGGNTNINLMNRLQLGGYLAYGTGDGKFKYRADLAYSLLPRQKYIWDFPRKLFTFTYVNDLNIPGQDLLTTKRDKLINSFSHAPTDNMSLQKMANLAFEQDLGREFSYKIAGRYLYDQPLGVVKYLQSNGTDTTVVDNVTTSDLSLSLSYTPGESFLQYRDKRMIIRRGSVELNLTHRIGMKGVLGSDYNYQITKLSAHKKIDFNKHIGTMDIRISGGKVWNRVPFPLLFIPIGNQSYIFHADDYNCMNFYEFATDRFLSGNVNFLFNWTPANWFSKKSKLKLSVGGRILYGPLSDNNNPELHPELFVFNQGVKPLGNTPYAEVNIGIANIFKILRVEYARRLTYLSDEEQEGKDIFKGSILLTGSFAF